MWFIINRFIKNCERDYSLEFITKFETDNTCDMYIKNLDPGLRDIILGMIYHPIIGYDNRYTCKGELIYREPIYDTLNIANTIGCNKDMVYIHIDYYTYGEFINRLDAEIRRYYATHSRIDIINNK